MERGKVARRDSREDYEQLVSVIRCWNERRVELFRITMPSEKLEFEGVMKFYYQYTSKDGQKVATKCIRVQNSATVENVIEVLVQKFRPDLRMLPNLASYVLYEVHNDNGQEGERKMLGSEKPLLVQLKWVMENKDGRFLLRNESVPLQFQSTKLTKAQKKALLDNVKKEREKKRSPREISSGEESSYNGDNVETTRGAIARSLYQIYPPSRFTRSITNPDLVKRWRGGDKRMLQRASPTPTEESVQVYADAILADTPSKSIPVTMKTTAVEVVRAAVEQYNLSDDPDQFCLVQVPHASDTSHVGLERILRDIDQPLALHQDSQLQLRRKNSFRSRSLRSLPLGAPLAASLVSLSTNHTLTLTGSSNEIGSHSTSLCLNSPGIYPRHCIIMGSSPGGYSIAPLDKSAVVIVNDIHVREPVPLKNNAIIQLGETDVFRLVLPDQTTPTTDQTVPTSTIQTVPIANQTPPTTIQTTPNSNHKTYSTDDLTPVGLIEGTEPWDGAQPTTAVQPSSKVSQSPPTSNRRRHNSATQLEQDIRDTLPASLVTQPGREGALLLALTLEVNGYDLKFKLAPAYSLYMMARHALYSFTGNELALNHSLLQLLRTTCSLIKRAAKDCRNTPGSLAFWLANSSELLHFLRRDYRLCILSHEYESPLISITRSSLRYFTECMVREIGLSLPAFWSELPDGDSDEDNGSQEPDVVPVTRTRQTSITSLYWSVAGSKVGRHGRPTITDVLTTLEATRSLLHSCRVNATLQTAIFNFLFRYISTRVFNKLVIDPKLCCLAVGGHMTRRLERVKDWAVREGLKLPVDEHLDVVMQAAHLLSSSKLTADDVQITHSRCSHLNSRQVSTLLQNYQRCEGEESVSPLYISQLLQIVHTNVDQKLDPANINLQEDPNHDLPFLLPEHGYSCDTIQGVPEGLEEFLQPIISAGHCQLVVANDNTRCWIPPRVTNQNSPFSTQASTQMSQTLPRNFGHTSFPHDAYARPQSAQPSGGDGSPSSDIPDAGEEAGQSELRIVFVTLDKSVDSLGINIKEMKINQYGDTGIFILSLSEGGPAHKDGTLQPGDQLLRINNISLQNKNREMVVNVLRSVSERVALTVAKDAALFYGISLNHSPRYSRKLDNTQPLQFAPPKEGTSHAKKAARREQRSRQQLRQPDYPDVHRQGYEYPPTSETPILTSPSRVPPTSSNPQLARWLHEQQHLVQQKSPTYHKVSIPSPYPESTPSVASHIPEREAPTHPRHPLQYPSYRPGTPPVQDSPDGRHKKLSDYTKFQSIDSPSSKVDSASTGLSETDLSKYFVPSDQLTSDSSYQGASQLPYKDIGLMPHPPGAQGFGPSYHMDKLSMQVTCHTQLTPGGEGPVVSVLEQLDGRKTDMKGLNSSELRQLDMDDIGLLKQRMQLLFYEQEKKKKEGGLVLEDAPKSRADMLPHHQGRKMDSSKETVNKGVEEVLIDPDKLLQITKLRNDLESVYKLISDQKKRCREIHFAREREEQSLRQAESKFRAQNSRQFGQFVRPEDETRWQRDQRRRLKEWERISTEKTRRLQQIDIDEHHGRSKLKALEQHFSEIKRQLQALEASGSLPIVRPRGGLTGKMHSHAGVPSKVRDEREWMGGPRVMSTDSINTSSSWVSGASKGIMGSYGSESNIASMEPAVEHSPIGLHSETSSPSLIRDSAPYWMPMRTRSHSELAVRPEKVYSTEEYRQQDSRLRALQEEHHHHHKISDPPSRSLEEKNTQLYQLKMEAQRAREQAKHASGLPDHAYTDQYRRQYRRDPDPEPTTPESSLSSSTPDVIPTSFAAGPLRLVNHYESRTIHKSLSSVLPTHLEHTEPENSRSMSDLHQQQHVVSYQPYTHQHTRQGSRDLAPPDSVPMVTKGDPSDVLAQHPSQSPRGHPAAGVLVDAADKSSAHQFRKPVKPVGSTGPQRYSRGRPEQQNVEEKAKSRYQPSGAGARQFRQQTEL